MTYRIWQQEKKSYIKPSPETNNNFHLQKKADIVVCIIHI